MPRFILASQSPRRHQLLQQIGVHEFRTVIPDADESYDPTLSPEEIVCSICRKKAEAARILAAEDDAILIAADTMVFLDGLRLGKPQNESEAAAMLHALSGRTHEVCTGVTISQGDRILTHAETTRVTFRAITNEEISSYIASGEPMDKAGAYGVQGKAALFVKRLEGDYFNVVGFPLHLIGNMLKEFNVDLFCEVS